MSAPEHRNNPEHHTALLYEASKLLGAPANLKSGLDALLTGVLHRHQLTTCLFFVEELEGLLHVGYSLGVSSTFAQSIHVPKGEGVLGIVFASALVRQVESPNGNGDKTLQALFQRHRLSSAVIVPLKADGRVIGTAFYGSQTVKTFSPETVQELSELSDHFALALYNGKKVSDLESSRNALEVQVASTVQELSRTNTRLVQKVRELKTVYDLALATAASRRVEDIVRVMAGGIKGLIEVQGAAFFLFEDDAVTLKPILPAFDLASAAAEKLICRPVDSPWLERVVKAREPQILNWVENGEGLPESWKKIGIRSILALPLLQDDRVRGIFAAINKVNGLFNQDDVRLLALLTGRVTDVLHRLALDQELHQRVHDLGVLQEISAQLPNPPVLTDTVAVVGRVAREALGADLCFFFLHHVESDALVLTGGDWDTAFTFDAHAFTLGTSEKVPLAQVFHDNLPAQFDRGTSKVGWQNDELLRAFDLDHLLYVPLSVEQRCLGVLAIGTRSPRSLATESRRLADLVAKQVAIVIERSRLYERLKSANEKLEQINHLKNEFISMVSHELRTPLTTIKGFVSIVLNEETGPLNDQQRHFLETSDRAIDRLTLLVSDLLDISRIEAGQIKMQQRPIHLKEVCQRLSASFAPQMKAQNITLTIQMPEDLPMVMADPDRIGQVLDNLLSNAIKYTTRGGITVTATDKGDFVLVSVKDTGSGIPKEEHDRIFDKFYQVKVGSGYPSKGTGLGLAIVKSIVESHRGKVWVESEGGKGADFRFILPRARTEAGSELA
jgi:signal transduction histidine kinase/putative methionine-R-sulfoxide reductase with GAF domain